MTVGSATLPLPELKSRYYGNFCYILIIVFPEGMELDRAPIICSFPSAVKLLILTILFETGTFS